MDEKNSIRADLVQLSKLALSDQVDDVRLFVARLVRKYRGVDIELAEQFELLLKNKATRGNTPYRKSGKDRGDSATLEHKVLPTDGESRLALLKVSPVSGAEDCPFLSEPVKEALSQMIQERQHAKRLHALGLSPTKSAIFLGKPGVGKSLSARWVAAQLGLPLYILDLTAVMSSFLGKTGSNLRAAIDFAKQKPSVLLLDEIDAIAKRRNDDTDVGELKRLVTVMLQEVEHWPETGLLLAATNHPEIVDPALWRRFDLVVEFGLPDLPAIKDALVRFLGPDLPVFEDWLDILVYAFHGESYSDIERTAHRFRRALALGIASESALIEELLSSKALALEHQERIDLAIMLTKQTQLSQHAISNITGVSRDTIRKYSKPK